MKDKSSIELMNMYAKILNELNKRGVIRTYNSPVGDYAEWLVAEKMGLILEKNSQKGFDAIDSETGIRYQVKSRWECGKPCMKSRELNVIRNFEENQFEYLIAVIFGEHFNVKEVYKIPHAVVPKYATYNTHQNGYILIMMGNLLHDPQVENITEIFK